MQIETTDEHGFTRMGLGLSLKGYGELRQLMAIQRTGSSSAANVTIRSRSEGDVSTSFIRVYPCASVVKLNRYGVACSADTLKRELQLRFLLDSEFWILNSSAVPKWCKTLIAVLLLPVCLGAAQALWMVLRASGDATTIWVASLAGAACWVVIYSLLPKPMWIYVFGHEFTHALWAWAFGGSVKNSRPRPKADM